MEFYHDLITQKSWAELQVLRHQVDFVLIGDWAVYFYTQALKSKDIDIVVNYDQLPLLEKLYSLYKNDRLKKYEAVKDELQIDIYLPHYSALGLPAEELLAHILSVEGFQILAPDYLLALKFFALSRRGRTPKGRKDFLDIISLLQFKIEDLPAAISLTEHYGFQAGVGLFKEMLGENFEIPELNLNSHHFSRFKKTLAL